MGATVCFAMAVLALGTLVWTFIEGKSRPSVLGIAVPIVFSVAVCAIAVLGIPKRKKFLPIALIALAAYGFGFAPEVDSNDAKWLFFVLAMKVGVLFLLGLLFRIGRESQG